MHVGSEQIASGEVAYRLQNGRSERVWGQKLGSDNDPLLTDKEEKHVYKVAFTYKGNEVAVRYANKGGKVLGAAYDANQTYALAFDGGFSETTAITGDKTVNVTVTITTGIDGVTNDAAGTADGPVYDLQGRRVADRLDAAARHQLPAGVYIVGGRKVVVK